MRGDGGLLRRDGRPGPRSSRAVRGFVPLRLGFDVVFEAPFHRAPRRNMAVGGRRFHRAVGLLRTIAKAILFLFTLDKEAGLAALHEDRPGRSRAVGGSGNTRESHAGVNLDVIDFTARARDLVGARRDGFEARLIALSTRSYRSLRRCNGIDVVGIGIVAGRERKHRQGRSSSYVRSPGGSLAT